jgi:hypothetical protein
MEEDDLLGEDLVNYEASPEHPGMDVNVISFSTDCTIVGNDEPVMLSSTLVLKRSPSLNQRNQ